MWFESSQFFDSRDQGGGKGGGILCAFMLLLNTTDLLSSSIEFQFRVVGLNCLFCSASLGIFCSVRGARLVFSPLVL